MTCEVCEGPASEDDRSDVFDCYICKTCHLKALEGWKRFNLGTDPPLTLNERVNRMYERGK
jgi:hypothetical protein